MSNSDTSLRVLLMRGGLENTWIAVCLEHYIVAQGMSTEDVIREFKAMLAAEVIYGIEHGNADCPLSNIEPAPQKYRDMFEQGKPFDPPSLSLDITIDSIPDLSLPKVEQLRLAA